MSDYRARLIAARERLGLSLREMAARLLTPRQTLEQWERGVRRTPGVAVVAAEKLSAPPPQSHKILALADGTRSARQIAEETGASAKYVYRLIWSRRRAGEPVTLVRRHSCPGVDSERVQRVRKLLAEGAAYRDVAAAEGITKQHVHQIAKRIGEAARRSAAKAQAREARRLERELEREPARQRRERLAQAVAAVVAGNISLTDAAIKYDVTYSSLCAQTKRRGVNSVRRRAGRGSYGPEQKQAVERMLADNMTAEAIAAATGVGIPTIRKLRQQHHLGDPIASA